ncbi:uncharacterized protein GIQ15_01959 [Arthroderma uncinatum]|uniref:uncharacterized protein n=1 Tax=Arthroderma uncinatum TaxID=74035 RepID=UPI00144AAA21|nr:uncharacterized protein GIQ15_01959 [Arthroderma uncinatum]KAF3482635.1 hypothetical protein GIQ15_01959 [Arthroderma uncinatum]
MTSETALYGRSASNLFRRCVVNCPTEAPPCPACKDTEICTLTAKSCEACAAAVCTPDPLSNPPPVDSGTPTGAIAGGVIGGLALVAALVLAWWFCVRRRPKNTEMWDEKRNVSDDFGSARQKRQSAVGSIASTVLTRASNVIQIAYIPGVTNRSAPGSPDLMVPPVPPIPSAVNNCQNQQQQHYFMPGDIRDSMWSGMTDDDGKSISPSLARSSVATTIYRHNAIVSPVPAQEAYRAKANIVSVKSGSSSPASSTAPNVPAITNSQLNKANAVAAKLGVSSIVARSAVARPINVTKGGRSKTTTTLANENTSHNTPKVTVESPDNAPSSDDSSSLDSRSTAPSSGNANSNATSQDTARSKPRESVQSLAVTEIDDSPDIKQSPFADPIIEEESSQSSASDRESQLSTGHTKRSASPFDDKHEVKAKP